MRWHRLPIESVVCTPWVRIRLDLALLHREPYGMSRRGSLDPPGHIHKRGTQLFWWRCGGTCITHSAHRLHAAPGRRGRLTLLDLTRRSSTSRWNATGHYSSLIGLKLGLGHLQLNLHSIVHLNLRASQAGHAVNGINQGERSGATTEAYP